MLTDNFPSFRCPPRVPTPGERLAGVLADLEELAADAWVDRGELAAIALNLRRALVAVGIRDRMVHIPVGPGWVPGEALRPVVAQFRMAFRSLGVT